MSEEINLYLLEWPSRIIIAFIQFRMWFGSTMITLSTGILGINPSVFEAAELDGASQKDVFFHITLPLIKPIVVYSLAVSTLGGLQVFDIPYLFLSGGPVMTGGRNATETIAVYIYKMAFTGDMRYNVASAASERTNTVKLTVRNNGSEKLLFGAELGSDASRQYAWIEAGQTVTVTLHSGEAYNVINFFLDCCYYGGEYDTEHATLSGDVDIVSLEFTNEQGGDPDQPSEEPDQPNEANGWKVVESGSAYYQISEKDGVLANVAYENVPKALWANLYRDVTDGERKNTVKLTLRNNGSEKLLFGVGETAVITLALSEEEAAKTGIVVLFLDCWESYMDDYASRPQDEQGGDLTSLSGKITILGVQTY